MGGAVSVEEATAENKDKLIESLKGKATEILGKFVSSSERFLVLELHIYQVFVPERCFVVVIVSPEKNPPSRSPCNPSYFNMKPPDTFVG